MTAHAASATTLTAIPDGTTPFDLAVGLHAAGSTARAAELLTDLAAVGIPAAQRNLGVLYATGAVGATGERDMREAYVWFSVAAAAGDSDAPSYAARAARALSGDELESARALVAQRSEATQLANAVNRLTPDCTTHPTKEVWHDRVVSREAPYYPRSAAEEGLSGFVGFQLATSPSGAPRHITTVISTDTRFKQSAARALRRWKLEPSDERHTRFQLAVPFKIANDADAPSVYRAMIDSALGRGNLPFPVDPLSAVLIADFAGDDSARLEPADQIKLLRRAASKGLEGSYDLLSAIYARAEQCTDAERTDVRILLLGAERQSRPAIYTLAIQAIKQERLVEHLFWLRAGAQLADPRSTVEYVWSMATAPGNQLRMQMAADDGLDMLDDVDTDAYADEVTLLEVRAALQAQRGDYRNAQKHQRRAIRKAEDIGFVPDGGEARLEAYANQRAWRAPIGSKPWTGDGYASEN